MNRDVLARCEIAESWGFGCLYRSVSEAAALKLGLSSIQIGSALAGRADAVPMTLFNRIIGLGTAEPASDEDLDRLEAFYSGRAFAIELAPVASGLEHQRLIERGYEIHEAYPKFVRDAAAPVPRFAADVRPMMPNELPVFAEVTTRSFGLPPEILEWNLGLLPDSCRTFFLAFVEGRPAGAATLYVHEGVGWLGSGCVLPEFRGHGLQAALIAARIQAAKESGCEWVTSETGPDSPAKPNYSFRNMVRCGFELAYERPFAAKGNLAP